MDKRSLIGGGLVVAGAIAALRFAFKRQNQPRPPIIVKGSSLVFSGERPWVKTGNAPKEWRPVHLLGKTVSNFLVTITGKSCEPMRGQEVQIVFASPGQTLTFNTRRAQLGSKYEPAVGAFSHAAVDMTIDNGGPMKTLTYGGHGRISSVIVAGDPASPCVFAEGDDPTIQIQPE